MAELLLFFLLARKMFHLSAPHLSEDIMKIFVTGNMWAQQWNNLLEDTIPFPGLPSMDVTDTMMKKV